MSAPILDKDVRDGMTTTVHGIKCAECAVRNSGEFSKTQMQRWQTIKGFQPLCKKCVREQAEKGRWSGQFDCSECRRKRLIAAEFPKTQIEKRRQDANFAMTCLRCSRNKEREGKEANEEAEGGAGAATGVPEEQEGESARTTVERKEKQEEPETETQSVIKFEPGKLGLSLESNAVSKAPAPESQAAQLGVCVGWVLHSVNGATVPADKKVILEKIGSESAKGTKAVKVTFRLGVSPDHHHCLQCNKFRTEDSFSPSQIRNKVPGKRRCKSCVAEAEADIDRDNNHSRFGKVAQVRWSAKVADAKGTPLEKLQAAAAECAAEAELVTGLQPIILGKTRRGGGTAGRGNGRPPRDKSIPGAPSKK
eukprot:gb/GEZN01005858.1/.p1 GENE.gb/GEZN01005858.1/~~gb/GEZN01005858.1/.p1  ORF type:complete len:365 (-),score=72.31 gb/GEZN01005858.1/:153-1247(-)